MIQSTHQFTELEQQHMEYLIRDVLLRHQLSTEREHHQRWLQSLRQLTGSLRLDELLLTIMDHALEVLPSASAGLFLMHDPISDNMQPRAQRGFHDSIYDYRAQTHEGITGRVFSEGVARVYPTFASIFEDIHNVDEERLGLVAGSFLGDDLTVHGMLAVPVRMHTDKIGVMLIYQFDDSRTLHQGDLDKLQGFADQAAIAIVHARMYSELLDNNRYLEQRSQIHRVYTQLSIDNAPLEQIVQTAADMLKFPVCFVDTEAQQTYSAEGYEYIATEQDTSGNAMWTTDDQYAVDAASHKIPSSNEQIYPVRNGSLLVGYFQLPIQRALEPLEEVILEQASAIVLLHMMNMYSMTGMLYRQSRDFFDELLQHRDPHTLADGLRRYGLHAESPLYVALLQVDSDTTDVRIAENHIRQLIARIDRQPERGAYLLFGSSDKITLLCNTSSASTPSQLAEQLDVIISHWQRDSSIPVYGGIGGAYDGLEQIARSHNEAGRALSYARRRRQTGVMTYADIGINRLFLQQEPQEIENYVQEILSPLRSPKYAAAELEQTLRMYIQENRIAAATAEKLFIHPNTLYVRLRRIEEILQVNLNDSGDWMKVYLACHLSETY
ncbi:helix-turn-helix domain-containing protein [Paenibacillus sp. WLX1005]|uniref:helix-turn-helix domain-containing protein n=1 Tax=Paenibacillus sp. WLX1005 TaxID=3243766 RepID=UPI003983FA6E